MGLRNWDDIIKYFNSTTGFWERKCKKCNGIMPYKNKKDFQTSVRKNGWCRSCCQKRSHSRPSWILKQKNSHKHQQPWNKGKNGIYSKKARELMRVASTHPMDLNTRRKISGALRKYFKVHAAHNKGTHHKESTKKKIRLSVIKTLQERFGKDVYPLYNPLACEYIDSYSKKHGYNFQHALNGGEYFIENIGYWVDGYDKEKNVVIEYYEPHHKYQIDKDETRKKQIIKQLKCKFIEIKSWKN